MPNDCTQSEIFAIVPFHSIFFLYIGNKFERKSEKKNWKEGTFFQQRWIKLRLVVAV